MPGDPGVFDVLQETNIILWEKMDSFELDSNFTAWAFTIARFEVLTHCRKQKRRNLLATAPEAIEAITEQISSDFEQGNGEMEDRIKALQHCLTKLSLGERELLTARYSDKTNLAEFARQSGRSDSSLRSALLRARAALRKCISIKLAQTS